jgi:hypothetical protein
MRKVGLMNSGVEAKRGAAETEAMLLVTMM